MLSPPAISFGASLPAITFAVYTVNKQVGKLHTGGPSLRSLRGNVFNEAPSLSLSWLNKQETPPPHTSACGAVMRCHGAKCEPWGEDVVAAIRSFVCN